MKQWLKAITVGLALSLAMSGMTPSSSQAAILGERHEAIQSLANRTTEALSRHSMIVASSEGQSVFLIHTTYQYLNEELDSIRAGFEKLSEERQLDELPQAYLSLLAQAQIEIGNAFVIVRFPERLDQTVDTALLIQDIGFHLNRLSQYSYALSRGTLSVSQLKRLLNPNLDQQKSEGGVERGRGGN